MKPTLRVLSGGKQELGTADYIWAKDGRVFQKTRVIPVGRDGKGDPVPIIEWWTTTDEGQRLLLLPAHYIPNPLRPQPSYLVLCEVRNLQDRIVEWNSRARLRNLEERVSNPMGIWFGIGVSYNFPDLDEREQLRANSVVSDLHLRACLDAGILIHSTSNAGYKLGPRRINNDIDQDPPTPLIICDHLWMSVSLLQSIAFDNGYQASFGMLGTIYVSSKAMRESPDVVRKAAQRMTSLIDPKPQIVAPDRGYTVVTGTTADCDPYAVAASVVEELFNLAGGDRERA